MIKKLLMGLIITFQIQASVRTDLEDRTKEQVVKKSRYLATKKEFFGPVVGCVTYYNSMFHGTGIAIDPYTVLTSAHVALENINYFCTSNPNTADIEDYYKLYCKIIYSNYKEKCTPNISFTKGENNNDCLFKESSSYTYDEYEKHVFNPSITGVDLAILKLDTPIKSSNFPEILESDVKISNTYGVSLGHGLMRYNSQEKPAEYVEKGKEEMFDRHLISVKVNSYESKKDGNILHGNYKGYVSNGNKTFITNSSMKKTEGLPVNGDSGGPLLISYKGYYKLAGIMSKNGSISVSENGKECKNPIHCIFPTWVDVRHYKDWIEKHMGKTIKK
jgi:secreted trypsin-like serine protease